MPNLGGRRTRYVRGLDAALSMLAAPARVGRSIPAYANVDAADGVSGEISDFVGHLVWVLFLRDLSGSRYAPEGIIYILANEAMPDYVKVGKNSTSVSD